MLLAIDISNTNIKAGVYQGDSLVADWRVATDHHRLSDEYAVLLRALFAQSGLEWKLVDGVVLGSVVPTLTATFVELSRKYLDCDPVVLGPGARTGIKILIDNPREVGADRIANTVAAYRKYGGPAIVVDFGTATTFDAVSADGDYLGGAIAPGVIVAAEALVQKAARLNSVEIIRPRSAIGKNTVTSMQSGILFGYVGLTEGLIARFQEELGPAKVIATGGLANLIAAETKMIEVVDIFLTLDGLRLIYELNVDRSEKR